MYCGDIGEFCEEDFWVRYIFLVSRPFASQTLINLVPTLGYMFRRKFKKKCALCKKNMAVILSFRQFPVCAECQMKRIKEEVTKPAYQFLNLSDELYQKSQFLRNIKEFYLRNRTLSEKQVAAFKKAAKDVKEGKEKEE